MDPTATRLNEHFKKIGTTVEIAPLRGRWVTSGERGFSVNVIDERFQIRNQVPVSIKVHDVRPDIKHLLLQVEVVGRKDASRKFLMGHDERHYFVAGVPAETRSVADAMRRLMPAAVAAQADRLPPAKRHTRHNAAFKRQGEWFFVPCSPEELAEINERWVLRDEPIRRGRSKPHRVSHLYRTGGVDVMVSREAPNGISPDEYEARLAAAERPSRFSIGWRRMRRDARVYVKGTVRHPDHATLKLDGWHRVWMNQEVQSEQMAFLD